METRIIEYLQDLFDRLEMSHMNCDLDSSDCDAEQYGDGNSGEHAYMQLLEQDIKILESESNK